MYPLYKSHPWHGINIGSNCPNVVNCFIECVPGDNMKYEIDKESGYLMVDRPHRFSSVCPVLYGFIPKTYCGDLTAQRAKMSDAILENIMGDNDPLDICVLSTRNVTHGNILVKARPIGGFRMLDCGEADDKIISIIDGDPVMKNWNNISDIPDEMLLLIKHYFLTYKQNPESPERKISIIETYGVVEAHNTILASIQDYQQYIKHKKPYPIG